mgnify:FL=1
MQIAKHYGIMCTYSDSLSCDGVISRTKDNVSIVIRKEQPRTRQRYTILHELGHYLLGHLDKEYQSEAEYAADRFAADVLMPACVLWGLQLHTANDMFVYVMCHRWLHSGVQIAWRYYISVICF